MLEWNVINNPSINSQFTDLDDRLKVLESGSGGSGGSQGAQGVQGPQGTQGSQGETGSQGNQGTQGPQGENGSQGAQGVQGVQGDSHIPSVTSADNGKILMVVNGVWTLVSPATLYSGSGAPNNSQGNNGDIYVQTNE